MKKRLFIILTGLAFSAQVEADKWIYGASYEFETGDYSQPVDTDIVTLPLFLSYYTERWGFGLEIPFVSVSGSADIIPSGNGQSTGHGKNQSSSSATSTESYTRSGLGDVSLFVSYAFPAQSPQELFYELGASVKLATADEKDNLGTGQTDYSINLKIARDMGNWSPSINIGYQLTGEGADENLNDVYFYSVGTGYSLSEASSVAFSYYFKQAVADGYDDLSNVGFNFTRVINRYIDLGVGLSKGLSDSSADYAVSLSLTGYY